MLLSKRRYRQRRQKTTSDFIPFDSFGFPPNHIHERSLASPPARSLAHSPTYHKRAPALQVRPHVVRVGDCSDCDEVLPLCVALPLLRREQRQCAAPGGVRHVHHPLRPYLPLLRRALRQLGAQPVPDGVLHVALLPGVQRLALHRGHLHVIINPTPLPSPLALDPSCPLHFSRC